MMKKKYDTTHVQHWELQGNCIWFAILRVGVTYTKWVLNIFDPAPNFNLRYWQTDNDGWSDEENYYQGFDGQEEGK